MLDDLQQNLINNQPNIPPKSLLGQAVSHTLNQWPKIINYLKNPRLEISNNLSERAIKPFVIGHKGWLFSNSVEGTVGYHRIQIQNASGRNLSHTS